MIQRIQTVYLALATFCLVMTYFLSFARLSDGTNAYIFDTNGLMLNGANLIAVPYQWIILVLVAYTTAIIFMYRNRPLQMRMGRMNYLMLLGLLVGLFFSTDAAVAKMPVPDAIVVSYGIGFYMPVAALTLVFLANRAIRSDENIVRSVDRLR